MGLSDLYKEKNALIEANRELRERLPELDPSDREGRREIHQTLDRNNREIAELQAEIASGKAAKAENRRRLESLFKDKLDLIEANRWLKRQRAGLDRTDREGRNDLNNTIYRNDIEIAKIEDEIAEIRAS